jgi:hypothetical protein
LEDEAKIDERLPLELNEDQSVKLAKDMKISGTMFSAAYFALMKANRKELAMTKREQFDVLWQCFYVLFV